MYVQQGSVYLKGVHSRLTASSAGLPVGVPCHEDTGTAGVLGALSPQALDVSIRVDLVVLEHRHLDLPVNPSIRQNWDQMPDMGRV